MTVEQALEELKKDAREFATIGDAGQALANNPDYFINLWNSIKRNYQFISDNTDNNPQEAIFDGRWLEACDAIGEIETINPSLKEWVFKIW